jgi:D-sedoheptulose 7-phosphate isomerase
MTGHKNRAGEDSFIAEMIEAHPQLTVCKASTVAFCDRLASCFQGGGKLLIAGNGGSMADAQHIAGELSKSFLERRALAPQQRKAFADLNSGAAIADNLQNGFPVWVLGLNASLSSAILNDFETPHMEYAQELWVAGSSQDLFLGISTSGRAKNVYNAMVVAKARKIFAVAFTGQSSSPLCEIADLSIQVPATETSQVQELQQVVYHTFCKTMEARFFAAPGQRSLG